MGKLILWVTLAASLFLSGCSKDVVPEPTLDDLYQSAVEDAIEADSSEICDTLWPINSTNSQLEWKTINTETYVLVGCFTKYPESYSEPSLINSWGILWVFLPAQFRSRMKSCLVQDMDTLLRMRQLFGLPRTNTSNYIVELWAKPKDIFRPAADKEIDDHTAGPFFPANADTTYRKWFNQNIYDSYFSNRTQYPWTRLGYTYDWSNSASEVGVSEYCIKTSSLVFVNQLSLAAKYLGN